MAIVKVADRGTRGSNATGNAAVDMAAAGSISVGNFLIARIAVDNTGASGASPGLSVSDPRSNSWSSSSFLRNPNNVASDGVVAFMAYTSVVNAYTNGDDITFNWTTGSPRSAIVIEEWSGILGAGNGNGGAGATDGSGNMSLTCVATNLRANSLLYVTAAAERESATWGAQDSDTLGAAWQDLTKDTTTGTTGTSAVSVYGGYKIIPSFETQTWNNTTGNTSMNYAVLSNIFYPIEYGATGASGTRGNKTTPNSRDRRWGGR